jgi:hypothetical protein
MGIDAWRNHAGGARGHLLIWPGFFLAFLVFFVSPAWGASLPDVLDEAGGPGRWAAGPLRVTALETASENLGRWQNRVYRRTAPIASVEVHLMEGEGFGPPYIPGSAAAAGDSGEALFPASAAYETLKIEGNCAILESSELTGRALSVALGGNRTLLIESAGLSPEELLGFAGRLIRILSLEERDKK